MKETIGVFIKMITQSYFMKKNKYPPLDLPRSPKGSAYERLKIAINENIWVEDISL